MSVGKDVLSEEVDERIKKTKKKMEENDHGALLVYGNNKIFGSLRYLTDYFPDRAGWVSLGRRKSYVFEGAVLVLTANGESVLLLDPGLIAGRETCAKKVIGGEGLSPKEGKGLSARNISEILKKARVKGKVGIETWDRFPTPMYLGLKKLLPRIAFERSTIVEELRMIKSPFEIELFRNAGMVGDMAHEVFVEELRNGVGKTELEIIRVAENAMRSVDPIYEDSCSCSPSLICSGSAIAGSLLHTPDHAKRIRMGDVVHWDICMRFQGYPIDTSRTKVIGSPTQLQKDVFETTLQMSGEVIEAAKPGLKASELVAIARKIASEAGYDLWTGFLGHGLGLDVHERPDMGVEETRLATNMVLAIEPRIAVQDAYLMGTEEMVLVTDLGARTLTNYEKTLEL